MNYDNSTLVLIILVCLAALYIIYMGNPIKNHGNLRSNSSYDEDEQTQEQNDTDYLNDSNDSSDESNNDSNNDSNDSSYTDDSSIDVIDKRSRGMNNIHFNKMNGNAKEKRNSYHNLNSGHGLLDDNFAVQDMSKNHTNQFQPLDESGGVNAPVPHNNDKKEKDNDKFDVNGFMPQEENKDWFETVDTVKVKNKHLINLYRPIGVNTIGNSHRNSSYDLRGNGDAICPKFVVAPWLQSTIEPDRTQKSLC